MIGSFSNALPGAMLFLVPIVGSVALFTFLAIASHAEERRKEREAYYRYEFQKKMLETGSTPEQIAALLTHQESVQLEREREGRKLGGLVTMAIGFGILFALRFVGDGVWMVGYIPIAIGAAITLYAFLLGPRRSSAAVYGAGATARPGETPRG